MDWSPWPHPGGVQVPETEAEEVRKMIWLPVFVPHTVYHAQTGFKATRFFISLG